MKILIRKHALYGRCGKVNEIFLVRPLSSSTAMEYRDHHCRHQHCCHQQQRNTGSGPQLAKTLTAIAIVGEDRWTSWTFRMLIIGVFPGNLLSNQVKRTAKAIETAAFMKLWAFEGKSPAE
mmetsp:Transcript_34384/g.83454  ORF Transcript_34384/g.83454 Transcript_34384/m.83454 type:complete len:121 (-) Transcript_34384:439-801(-)